MSARAQRGVAIVLAMGVVALAALAASAMMVSQGTWSRQAELTSGHVQAQLLLQAGLDWARAVLSADRRMGNEDHLGEPWALRLPAIPVERGSLAGRIEDQQARFNLNNLAKDGKANPAQLERFRRLLSILGLPDALAGALADWIDADGEPQAQGAEDAHYLALQPPYLAANRPLTDVAELALVRGFDEAVRARLRPFVTALPRFTAINVNTAPPEVLSALVKGFSLDDARALAEQRARGHFRSHSEFVHRLPAGLAVPLEDVAFGSEYFIATMQVSVDGARAGGTALLSRGASARWPAVVWRKTP